MTLINLFRMPNLLFSIHEKFARISIKKSLFAALCMIVAASAEAQVELRADFDRLRDYIGNKSNNINLWNGLNISNVNSNEGMKLDFVEYVQFMQATGGDISRDPFKNPKDFSARNDYDFSKLIRACKIALDNGMIPYIKFSVPHKFAKNTAKGGFGMNPYPPEDYGEYYDFISALCAELVKNFGKAELEKWKFCALTEFDNKSWFVAKSGNVDETKEAFFKLYDCIVDAIDKNISPKAAVGAHAMRSKDSFWDASELFEHCAKGRNFKTGEIGTRINFFAVSYYDYDVKNPSLEQLGAIIQILRTKAESLGLKGLTYGVDEGRILWGRKGVDSNNLLSRIVGDSYQAAFDARLTKEMADFNIDYFSSWGYSAGNPFASYPHVSYYVALSASKFKYARRAKLERIIKKYILSEVDALAGFDEKSCTARILAYSYRRESGAKNKIEAELKLKSKRFAGKELDVSLLSMDNSKNFFSKFNDDRKKYAFKDEDFKWSPDSVQLDSASNWKNKEQYELYKNELRPEYVKASALSPLRLKIKASPEGEIIIKHKFMGNSAVFIEAKEIADAQ